MKYRVMPCQYTKSLHRLEVKRIVKRRLVWVCIGFITGRTNANALRSKLRG